MIPFVRTAWELEACLETVDASPLSGELAVWVMAEVPSVAYWIPEYAAMGIEGVSIGSNDLTQLMLGVIATRKCARSSSTSPIRPCSTPSPGSSAGAIRRASRRHCAGRPPPIGRSSPSTSCASASPRSRSTLTRWTPPGTPSPRPSVGWSLRPPILSTAALSRPRVRATATDASVPDGRARRLAPS